MARIGQLYVGGNDNKEGKVCDEYLITIKKCYFVDLIIMVLSTFE